MAIGFRFLIMVCTPILLTGCLLSPNTRVDPPASRQVPPSTVAKPAAKPKPAGPLYTVQSGDTLYSIAFRQGLDYREVARWNQLSDPGRIQVGQVLRMSPPKPTSASAAPTPIPAPRQQPVVTTRPTAPSPVVSASPQSPPTSRTPTSVSTAIGLTPKPAPVVSAPPGPTTTPAPVATTGQPQTTPIADEPALAPPQPLSSDPIDATPTTKPVEPVTVAMTSPTPTATPTPTPVQTPAQPMPVQPATVVEQPAVTAPAPSSPLPPINPNAPTKLVSGIKWRWPVEGNVVGRFVAGDPTESGIEIGGRLGQVIAAAADGEVVYSGNGLLGYGELIIIQHTPNFLSAYGHNQKRLVAEGTKVKAGQPIAEMGRQAGIDLLHFEIRQGGKPVDPIKFLP